MPLSSATETGEILHLLPGGLAKVKIPKRSTCQSCAHRGFCNPFGTEFMSVSADNALGAKPGQQVEISFQPQGQKKAILILYLFPLIALVSGALIGWYMNFTNNPDASAALSSLGCLVLVFAVINWHTKRQARKQSGRQPRIIRIVS